MHPPAAYLRQLDLKRRAASSLLSLAIVGLIVLALLRLGVGRAPEPEIESEPNSFALSPEPEAGPRPSPEAAERRADAASPPERAAADPVEPEPPVAPPPPVPAPPPFPDILILDREQFAASDIGRRRSTGRGEEDGEPGGAGANSVAAYGPGEGPGGQRLFNAEWHREPSRAELAGYLPPSGAPPGSWAVIACRTIERYEVENCRALGESPAGSGLARAMRQAAWQFRVRPPRVGGRSLVGEWVRIRITFDRAE